MTRHRRTPSLCILILSQVSLFVSPAGAFREPNQGRPRIPPQVQECPVFSTRSAQCDPIIPESFLPPDTATAVAGHGHHREPDLDVPEEMLMALGVLQDEYYANWLGLWPDGIDWTRAVLGTHVSGAIRTLSESLASVKFGKDHVLDWKLKSNLIDSHFTQIVAYYFGEDHFAIRHEAYDDMLWVVLGWLEAVQFLNTHTEMHYMFDTQGAADGTTQAINSILSNQTYHGNRWIPAFSHRARIFWELASQGWDTALCGGGMIWNPRLVPYKNAITNELFIAASIAMYLHFPGDENDAPFSENPRRAAGEAAAGSMPTARRASEGSRDAKYLKAAIDGYRWLASSNMTNEQGLYTDGFHISGYSDRGNNNTKCDQRDNMVLTYNQGVLLTGLRGLWDATGALSYLADGHALIQRVIRATGYDLSRRAPYDDLSEALRPGKRLPRWHGLGRAGVLEDPCDASAVCNQDATTFKGIYFHHLTAFCAPLRTPSSPDMQVEAAAFRTAQQSHEAACAAYRPWIGHNVQAALGTRDAEGKFGQWWTAGLLLRHGWSGPWPSMADDGVPHDTGASDYAARRRGPYDLGLVDASLRDGGAVAVEGPDPPAPAPASSVSLEEEMGGSHQQQPLGELRKRGGSGSAVGDPNKRGRGRTVETQSRGLALLRAYWKAGRTSAA